jgi:signal transduction histidine kinase/ActR/RegA family two-component response regulator
MHGLRPGTFGATFDAFLDTIVEEDRASVQEKIGRAIAGGAKPEFEYRTIWPDGSVHRISSSSRFVVDENGIPERGAGVCVDVTDRRLLEAQLQQSQKMEAVGQLAGGIAHDFNNLLTIISGNVQLALSTVDDADTREDLDATLAAANRAAQLTRQLLLFSRKHVLHAEGVDVNVLIEEIVPMLRRLIGEDIVIETVTAGNGGVTIADRAQLEQALMNLALNARDAMPLGGTLRMACETVSLDAAEIARQALELEPGSYARVSVTDSGTGMEPEVLARAFEPFFTTKPVGKGTGLGLASVYGAVKQMGGHVGIESDVGVGTTVTIYLPRSSSERIAAPRNQPKVSATMGAGKTVLVVEDEGAVRHLAARSLARAGYEVLQAACGEEALACAEAYGGEIAVMLSDVVMPGMSTNELITRLRATRPHTAVLLMSGYPKSEILRKGISAHEFELIEKPFTPEAVQERIAAVLARVPQSVSTAGLDDVPVIA